jgi:hypothetical protein
MTQEQIRSLFHSCDNNGDGDLNDKEFKRLLEKLSINMSDSDRDLLMMQFDKDGDGRLNLEEFTKFIEQEKDQLKQSAEAAKAAASKPSSLPSPIRRDRPKSAKPAHRLNQTAPASSNSGGSSRTRPQSASAARTSTGDSNRNSSTHKPGDTTLVQSLEANSGLDVSGTQVQPFSTRKLENAQNNNYNTQGEERTYDYNAQAVLNKLVKDNEINGNDGPDAGWLAQALRTQAKIEGKLGNRYYPRE